jgi:hypothetical protein
MSAVSIAIARDESDPSRVAVQLQVVDKNLEHQNGICHRLVHNNLSQNEGEMETSESVEDIQDGNTFQGEY